MRTRNLYPLSSLALSAILLVPSLAFSAAPAATTTTLDVATQTIVAGKPLELTARVLSATGLPAGNVSFYDGTTLLGTAPLNELALSDLFVATLHAGSHSLTAVYSGESSYAASTSDAVTVAVTPAPEGSTTREVPAQYKTIQAAIDAAKDGDTVLVAPGVYKEHISFAGKAIVVTSSAGPEKTILDGFGSDPIVLFKNNETRNSVLNGFTIRNGADNNYDSPAAISIEDASPTITSNIVTGNAGCGILMDGSPYVAGNTIEGTLEPKGDCTAFEAAINLDGGSGLLPEIVRNTIGDAAASGITGISSFSSEPTLIEENIIRNNTAGGIVAYNDDSLIIVDNLILGNTGGSGISLSLAADGLNSPVVVNNTILGNSTAPPGSALAGPQIDVSGYYNNASFWNNVVVGVGKGPAIYCDPTYLPQGPAPGFYNNDAYSPKGTGFGGGCSHAASRNGNIAADPKFVNPEGPDYSLLSSSPAIDAGTKAAPDLPVYDIDAQPRVQPGKRGKLTVDMGAFEYSGATRTTLSTDNLDFGNLTIFASSAAKAITLANKGTKPLHIEQIAASGDYSETDTCRTAFGIMPNSSCVIKVVFSPIARGARAGSLVIRSNSTAGVETVRLSGTATGAVASLSPNTLTFARQQLFTSSDAQHVMLGNSGNDVLTLSSVTASGDFAAHAACRTIAPGKSCAIEVVFKPTTRGDRSGILDIRDNATTRIQTARLSGTGIGPDISFSASQLVFTGVPVSVVSQPQTLTISNRGESTLNLKYQVTGPFAASGNCGSTVGVGASCALQVTFNPIVSGSSSGSIAFTDNAAASPQSVSLSGTAGTPTVSLPTAIIFPTVIVNTTGKTYVDLFNNGSAYLTVSAVSVTSPFTQTNNCIGVVPAGKICEITLTFAPTSTAPASGSLTVTDTAAGGSQSVSISAAVASTHSVAAITNVNPGSIQAGGPDFAIFIDGSNIFADSVVEWNGTALQSYPYSPNAIGALVPSKLIATAGQANITVFNPAPGGGTSNALPVTVYSTVAVSARDMVWDATRQLIYLSTDIKSKVHANAVLSLDPNTGRFGTELLTGNEPGKLAVTADGKYLYAETDKNHSVTRIELATGKPDLAFPLGKDTSGNSYIALDMVPVPGDDSSVAISLGNPNEIPSSEAVQIFKDGKPQPTQVNGERDSYADSVLYLNGPGTLYASDTEDTGDTLSVFTIDAAGLSVKNTYSGLGGGQLATDGKNLFVGNGQIVSPVTFSRIATLPYYSQYQSPFGKQAVTVDSQDRKAYFATTTFEYGGPGIFVVSTTTFKVLGEIPFNDFYLQGGDHIVRFGTNGIALRSSSATLTMPGSGSAYDSIILLHSSLAGAN